MKMTRFLIALVSVCLSVGSVYADAALRPGDSLELSLGGVPPDDTSLISHSYSIDGEGYLNLSYIGKVKVSELTPSQIQTKIERMYVDQGIFTHPTVTLNIPNATRLVTVGGEVNSKGRIPYTSDMTVMSAIGAAGDFTIYANQRKVRLIRGNTIKIIDCRKVRANPSLDEKVLPGDNIQVDTSMF